MGRARSYSCTVFGRSPIQHAWLLGRSARRRSSYPSIWSASVWTPAGIGPECSSACDLATDQPGFLFEKFVATQVRALGIEQVSLQSRANCADGRVLQKEVDIAANFNSRLFLIDCVKIAPRNGNHRGIGNLPNSPGRCYPTGVRRPGRQFRWCGPTIPFTKRRNPFYKPWGSPGSMPLRA